MTKSSLEREVCAEGLKAIGGVDKLLNLLEVDREIGLTNDKVAQRKSSSVRMSSESPMKAYYELLLEQLEDPTLLILLAAAGVSLIIGIIEEGAERAGSRVLRFYCCRFG